MMPDFREAHRWLRGYSDAKLGKPKQLGQLEQDAKSGKAKLLKHDEAYLRGYATGCGR